LQKQKQTKKNHSRVKRQLGVCTCLAIKALNSNPSTAKAKNEKFLKKARR
jgi:hypothetical protein